MRTWITWSPRGRDSYTNPRSTVAHFADATGGPAACGRWVPDDFDAIIRPSSGKRCRNCLKALGDLPEQQQPIAPERDLFARAAAGERAPFYTREA